MDSSRAERLALVRLTAVALLLGWAAMRPDTLGIPIPALTIMALGYAIAVVAAEAGRRLEWLTGGGANVGLLAVDGVFLAVATYVTGGTHGPTGALVYLHVVAVSMLLGARTGVAVAVWHSGLLIASLGAQAASMISVVDLAPGAPMAIERFPVLHVTAFWLFVCVTVLLAALEQRDAARRDAEALARAGLATVLNGLELGQPTDGPRPEKLDQQLRAALERGELRLVFQPIVNLSSGRIAGLEALLRWEHPGRGRLVPGDFIGAAEESGAILPVGRWVLRRACEQVMEWRASGVVPRDLFVSVNVSDREVREPGFIGAVEEALAWSQMEPSGVVLEIRGPTSASLESVRALGVKVAMELADPSIRVPPVDALKVAADRLGAAPLGDRRRTMVAVGIEDVETAERMRAIGCRYGQGYYFARPLTVADIDEGVEGLATDHRWCSAGSIAADVGRRPARITPDVLAHPTAA